MSRTTNTTTKTTHNARLISMQTSPREGEKQITEQNWPTRSGKNQLLEDYSSKRTPSSDLPGLGQ